MYIVYRYTVRPPAQRRIYACRLPRNIEIIVLKKSDFNYHLPPELIAQAPLAERSASRLLLVPPGGAPFDDRRVRELPELLQPGDLLVFNDTRVIPARLYGRKQSGGRVEVLIERLLDGRTALAHVRASKAPRPGSRLCFEAPSGHGAAPVGDTLHAAQAEVLGRRAALFELSFDCDLPALLQRIGHIPLPPYIDRADQAVDRERYQTVYARRDGAVAAPTAGLHFTDAQLTALRAAGID